jgi:hypothetical protein
MGEVLVMDYPLDAHDVRKTRNEDSGEDPLPLITAVLIGGPTTIPSEDRGVAVAA